MFFHTPTYGQIINSILSVHSFMSIYHSLSNLTLKHFHILLLLFCRIIHYILNTSNSTVKQLMLIIYLRIIAIKTKQMLNSKKNKWIKKDEKLNENINARATLIIVADTFWLCHIIKVHVHIKYCVNYITCKAINQKLGCNTMQNME